jgi:hypothetical protein
MANKTFGDLPARSEILNDDFFITNRASNTNYPEGRLGINVLKNYLFDDLIVKNAKFSNTTTLDVKITKQSIFIKDGNNNITFKDVKKLVHGFFQIKCNQSKGNPLGSSLCTYTLTYVPNDIKFNKVTFFSSEILEISNTSSSVTADTYHHLFIDPFIPDGIGQFRLDIQFLSTVAGAKCTVESSILLLETY